MAESATEVKLFGKWSLDDVEVSDLALVVRLRVASRSLSYRLTLVFVRVCVCA